ncbi:hypothetical protein APA_2643 [Pseudanabaena sp. lw0831]|nr:hypothetical protein APA_2643 [Pseudanabaena sp. lw0831]
MRYLSLSPFFLGHKTQKMTGDTKCRPSSFGFYVQRKAL